MKITKFPQSCILIESNGINLLVDPSATKYDEKFLNYWKTADAILITHKHGDHMNKVVLENLNIPIYSTKEVATFAPNLNIKLIKEGDTLKLGNIKIDIVKAIHGYMLAAGEILENVGFIIDDGTTKLYITSDTIRFKNDYKADILFADITAFDASMNLWGAAQTYHDVGAKLLIVAHQDTGKMMYKKEEIERYLKEDNINFIYPEILQTFEI